MSNENDQAMQPDINDPSPERQAELEAAYNAQKDTDAPYKGVQIDTFGELQWIMQQRGWSGKFRLSPGMARANLRGACLLAANLKGIDLYGANLSEADLRNVNLSSAFLREADLSGANLSRANLSGASLRHVNLYGSNIRRVLLSTETILDDILIDPEVRIDGVRWSDAPLNAISWEQALRFGDEPTFHDRKGQNNKERALLYRNAARAYHGLVVALQDQGLGDVASGYRLRELAMQRKALFAQHNYGGWLLNVLLGSVAGHGEKPGRAFGAYLGIVATFSLIFWVVTNFIHTGSQQSLQWYEALVLSVSSFHGRGFFTNTINLGDPLAIVAAFEAVSGLFIELIFIATFSRRFLGE
jgi:Pentapeptide repeats (8 copies)